MKSNLYAKDGEIFTDQYFEIYIPMDYFQTVAKTPLAINMGSVVRTFGVLYCRAGDETAPLQLFQIPTVIDITIHEFVYESITIPNGGGRTDVMTLKFMKNTQVMHQTLPEGKDVAESFLSIMMNGKLPHTIDYRILINMWWQNLLISGVSFQVPSKIYEMIIATIYRDPRNIKKRFGQYFGKETKANPYDYATGNVRSIVKNQSTFSGMVFEDIAMMISNGISNSIDNKDEQVSSLEKIIYM